MNTLLQKGSKQVPQREVAGRSADYCCSSNRGKQNADVCRGLARAGRHRRMEPAPRARRGGQPDLSSGVHSSEDSSGLGSSVCECTRVCVCVHASVLGAKHDLSTQSSASPGLRQLKTSRHRFRGVWNWMLKGRPWRNPKHYLSYS